MAKIKEFRISEFGFRNKEFWISDFAIRHPPSAIRHPPSAIGLLSLTTG